MGVVYMAEQTGAGPAHGRPQDHQAGHGHAAGDRPLRGRAAGAGDDGPSEHRQGASTPARPTAGRPYFVMELVNGDPDHPVLRRTAPDAARAAGAVHSQSARPCSTPIRRASSTATSSRSNVLVALYDGRPVPKVIDFGVAKAIGQRLTEQTMFTGFGQIVGTIEYMSPEQAAAEPAGHRHAERRLLAGRAALRTADRRHAV